MIAGTTALVYIQRQSSSDPLAPQDEVAGQRAGQGADGLETKGGEHETAAVVAGDAFGNDEVGRWIIATEGQAHTEEEDKEPRQ